MIFCLFVVVGSVLTLGAVLDFADAVLFLLALFNIIGLFLLAPVVKEEVAAFRAARRSATWSRWRRRASGGVAN